MGKQTFSLHTIIRISICFMLCWCSQSSTFQHDADSARLTVLTIEANDLG